jgi:hypothetical protein
MVFESTTIASFLTLAFLLLFWLHETVIKTQQMAKNRLPIHLIFSAFLAIIL